MLVLNNCQIIFFAFSFQEENFQIKSFKKKNAVAEKAGQPIYLFHLMIYSVASL